MAHYSKKDPPKTFLLDRSKEKPEEKLETEKQEEMRVAREEKRKRVNSMTKKELLEVRHPLPHAENLSAPLAHARAVHPGPVPLQDHAPQHYRRLRCRQEEVSQLEQRAAGQLPGPGGLHGQPRRGLCTHSSSSSSSFASSSSSMLAFAIHLPRSPHSPPGPGDRGGGRCHHGQGALRQRLVHEARQAVPVLPCALLHDQVPE